MFGDTMSDVNQQWTRTAGRVVNADFFTVFQVIGNDFRHQQRHFMRCIEFARFFACVGSKHTDEIFVDKAQYVIALFAVHRNIGNQHEKVFHRIGLAGGGITQFAQARFQGFENAVKNRDVVFCNIAAESAHCSADVGNIEIRALG